MISPSPNFLVRLLRLLRGHRLLMATSITFGLLFAGTTLIPPLLIRRLINWLTLGGGSTQELLLLSALLIGVYLARGVCRYGYGRFSHVVAYRVLDELLVQVYRHLQRLSHRFYTQRRTGELIARSINDIEAIEDFIAHGIPETVLALVIPATMLLVLCTINVWLALIVILPLPLVALLIFRFTQPIRKMWRQVRSGVSELVAQVQDNLAGMTEIKSFGREKAQAEQIRLRSARFRDASIQANNISLLPAGLIELGGGVGMILAVWFGGSFALQGQMSVADLFVFVVYLGHIYQPFLQLANLTDVLNKAASSCERVFELLDIEPEITNPPNPIRPAALQGAVTFCNVTFAYDEAIPVLHDISFQVAPGEMLAVVGATGAGKSTLMSLVQRFYDPQTGQILIDGHDIRRLDLDILRRHISAVLQDVFLFHGTIRQNILFGRPEASEAEMIAAAQAANAEEFILELPEGYDTVVGERGVRLSGGQKQRISIARALLKDAPILILDEATSAVDGETEWLIQQALSRLTAQRTTLIIAHRLSTITKADRIVVLDKGRIVEMGPHETLMKRNGHYARMVRMQELSRSWQLERMMNDER
jgi:ATP-binding cassette subfamily B protein/subfamily B ATP-binding cassette protein MsbA